MEVTIKISNAALINCFDAGHIDGWGEVKKGASGKALVTGKGMLKVEEFGDEDKAIAVHEFRREHIIRGIQVLAVKHPHLLTSILQDDSDMYTADALIQAGIFGDVKYG